MGIYSTTDLTREDAIKSIRAFVRHELDDLSDDELCDVLFGLFGERHLNNFMIVEENAELPWYMERLIK